jgi:hypothetical protein
VAVRDKNELIKSHGFAGTRRSHSDGYTLNGPYCMVLEVPVFGRFKVVFADVCRKPFLASKVKKGPKDMSNKTQKWVEHCLKKLSMAMAKKLIFKR